MLVTDIVSFPKVKEVVEAEDDRGSRLGLNDA